MSKRILEKLDKLEQELDAVEKFLISKKHNYNSYKSDLLDKCDALEKDLQTERTKNKKISDILYKNINKLNSIIEKEEKRNA
ncbi:MAG: hypothetical protein N4A43_05350 [Alphaproteobacteria bacterium]|jgi:predicted RND superfamily exporter protein|nr:hypothetical protein [Alphaproteobacteria bacterium]